MDARTCPECGGHFYDAITLKRHMLIHTGETPYNCFYCDYASNRKESLMSHCARKHEMDAEEFKAKAKMTFLTRPRGRPKKRAGGSSGGGDGGDGGGGEGDGDGGGGGEGDGDGDGSNTNTLDEAIKEATE